MRTWRTFAGVCWTGKRFDFDGGAQEILGRWTESPSHGFAVPAPFRQGSQGDGGTDCHSQCAHWLRNDTVFARSAVQGRFGRTEASAPTEGNKKPCGAGRRGRRPLRMGRGVRIATASVRTGFAMTHYRQCGGAGRCEHRPLRMRYRRCGTAGRCERVAAVKIGGVRRKAA